MIVADTSALLAVVFGEDDGERHAEALTAGARVLVGAATVVEASIVAQARHGADGARDLDLLLQACAAEVVPLNGDHVDEAVRAWRRFGKGRHPAALNLGDCLSYATAVVADAPLLYKGDDFTQTDIRGALPPA